MLNLNKERTAVHKVGQMFSQLGWIFREQPIADVGIDALVEIMDDRGPGGRFIAVQVKGGEYQFVRGEQGLTYYFSNRHYQYWSKVVQQIPLLILIHDQHFDRIYWQFFESKYYKNTGKNWKILLPYTNLFDKNIKSIVKSVWPKANHPVHGREPLIGLSENQLFISFGKYQKKNPNFYIELSLNNHQKRVSLNHNVIEKFWDNTRNDYSNESPYEFTLLELKLRLLEKFEKIKFSQNQLDILEKEIRELLGKGDLGDLAEKFFNEENKSNCVPSYNIFIDAFKGFSGLSDEEFDIMTVGSRIDFLTNGRTYIVETFAGRKSDLKGYFSRHSYDELFSMTDVDIWNEIYVDGGGIEKDVFIPIMLREWEAYWDYVFGEAKNDVGSNDHLKEEKEVSWRQFQLFSEGYNESVDLIIHAYNFDCFIIYPIAVFSMLEIWDEEVCFQEYCEFEYINEGNWDNYYINEEDEDNMEVFYICEERL